MGFRLNRIQPNNWGKEKTLLQYVITLSPKLKNMKEYRKKYSSDERIHSCKICFIRLTIVWRDMLKLKKPEIIKKKGTANRLIASTVVPIFPSKGT